MKTTLTLWAYRPSAFTGLGWVFAQAVCLWTGSRWCHVGVSLDNWYIEADPFKGVVDSRLEWKKEWAETRLVGPRGAVAVGQWRVEPNDAAERWLQKQIGKPYDWPGILGFIWRRTKEARRSRGKWFCSELATVVLRKFGMEPCFVPFDLPAWEIDPGELVTNVTGGML